MSDDCPDCAASQTDWTWGGYHSQCEGCQIRMLVNAMPEAVKARLDEVEGRQGEAAMQELRAKLETEYRRIRALRRATRGKQ